MKIEVQFLASLIMSATTLLFRMQVCVEQALLSTAMTSALKAAKAVNNVVCKTVRSFR